jgi:hypothetical protein
MYWKKWYVHRGHSVDRGIGSSVGRLEGQACGSGKLVENLHSGKGLSGQMGVEPCTC